MGEDRLRTHLDRELFRLRKSVTRPPSIMNSTLLNHRYRIVRSLGRGGFGETFLAQDTHMPSGRYCAIKQLKPAGNDPQILQLVRERFAREAAIVESLGARSDRIPSLYAYFNEAGQFYLVQEWIDGQTLADKVALEGVFDERRVRSLLKSLLSTLEYVHSQGIVHRDLKPENIILRKSDSEPVLIDFGAVRETMATTLSSTGNVTHSIVIGTPGFMSAEQAAGRPVFASDLYSLGMTAIYALTGLTPQQIIGDPQTGALLWQGYAQGVSPQLAAVLDKAIESHPRDRYTRPQEMRAALDPPTPPALGVVPSPGTPIYQVPIPATGATVAATDPSALGGSSLPSPPGFKKTAIARAIAGGLVGVGTLVGIGFALNQPEPPPPVTPIVEILPLEPEPPAPEPEPPEPEPEPVEIEPPPTVSFYYLADSAFGEANRARKQLQRLKANGYEEAGLFWIPDYANLSGKPYTQVYVATFEDRANCAIRLKSYGRDNPDAYCALASTDATVPANQLTARDAIGSQVEPAPKAEEPEDRPSPEDAIRSYYETLNGDRYRTAWGMLSKSLQNNRDLHPDGFSDYSEWWDSVDFVEVAQIEPIEVDPNDARVRAQLNYHMKAGNISSLSLEIQLVWDDKHERWLYEGAQVD